MNTPDRDTSQSPAQILFARQLKDTMPTNPKNLQLRPEWILMKNAREQALAKRHLTRELDLQNHTKDLKQLEIGDTVQVQNQRENDPNKWDLSGLVTEKLEYEAYMIRMDGTGKLTKRNRRFLRPIVPFNQLLSQKLPQQTFTSELVRNPTNISSSLQTDRSTDQRLSQTNSNNSGSRSTSSGWTEPVPGQRYTVSGPVTADRLQHQHDVQATSPDRNYETTHTVSGTHETDYAIQSSSNNTDDTHAGQNPSKRVCFKTKRLITHM